VSGNDQYTKALLHFDGLNGSTTISDDCAGATHHIWTSHNGSISTAQSRFGGASYNSGAAVGWVDTPDSADFTLGSGDFTTDFWFYVSGGAGLWRGLASQMDFLEVDTSWWIWMNERNEVEADVSSDGTTISAKVTSTTAITTAGWHHLAFVRTGNVLKLFLDGTQEGGDASYSDSVWDSSQS
jgi:hypothetical protein